VLGTRPERREVIVGGIDELHRPSAAIGEVNWLGAPPAAGDAIQVQIRHRAPGGCRHGRVGGCGLGGAALRDATARRLPPARAR
jgi:hypothetical protein